MLIQLDIVYIFKLYTRLDFLLLSRQCLLTPDLRPVILFYCFLLTRIQAVLVRLFVAIPSPPHPPTAPLPYPTTTMQLKMQKVSVHRKDNPKVTVLLPLKHKSLCI